MGYLLFSFCGGNYYVFWGINLKYWIILHILFEILFDILLENNVYSIRLTI
jgi:hypothetical protein